MARTNSAPSPPDIETLYMRGFHLGFAISLAYTYFYNCSFFHIVVVVAVILR